jgi:hypothetical protein
MTKYSMATRMGSVVITTNASSLKEAISYFAKMKQLPEKEFLKLFVVTETQ